jgi:hypothetical protein
MSTLGQLSGRIDRNLKRVDELTKSVIAVRAQMLGKVEALKLSDAAISEAKQKLADFLDALAPVLGGKAQGDAQQKLILRRLVDGGRQPTDYAADFAGMSSAIKSDINLSAEQLNKASEVVGYLQGEVAEEVRRLRSR